MSLQLLILVMGHSFCAESAFADLPRPELGTSNPHPLTCVWQDRLFNHDNAGTSGLKRKTLGLNRDPIPEYLTLVFTDTPLFSIPEERIALTRDSTYRSSPNHADPSSESDENIDELPPPPASRNLALSGLVLIGAFQLLRNLPLLHLHPDILSGPPEFRTYVYYDTMMLEFPLHPLSCAWQEVERELRATHRPIDFAGLRPATPQHNTHDLIPRPPPG